ncbi:MAG: CHAT domain-containing protein [Flavobacteriales bacterium]|nr:CHAT domain-containing protein [Flavobacteriales bacterium]
MRAIGALMMGICGSAVLAQTDPLAVRHARIGALYEAKEYPALIREIDAQITAAEGTTWADSLHRYLYKYGRAYRKVKDAAAGTAAAERIYALVKARGNADHELEALFDLSWTYYDVGEMKQCARVDSLAVVVADSDPKVPIAQRGRARQYLAFDHSVLGDHRSSGKWALSAIAQYEQADSIPPEQWAESYTAAGVAAWHLGRIREAESYYMKALEKLGDGTSEAILMRKVSAYGNLGVLWQNAGDFTRAKNNYHESLRYSDRVIASTQDQFTRDEAIVGRSRGHLNLATVYFQLGDNGRARELLDMAWRDRSSVLEADDAQLISVKERFADLELNAGNLAKAQALMTEYVAASERKFGTGSEEYIRASSKLGEVMARQARYAQADSLFGVSIAAGQRTRMDATDAVLAGTLQSRATARIRSGRTHEAMEDLERARAIIIAINDSTHYKVAQVEVLMAEAAFASGDVEAANAHARTAMRILGPRAKALRESPLPRAFPEPHVLPDAVFWNVRTAMALAGPAPSAAQLKAWNADLDLAIVALSRNKAAVDDAASKLLLTGAQERLFDLALDVAYASRDVLGMEAACARFLAVSEADRSTLLKERLNAFKGLRFAGVPDTIMVREQELITAMDIDPDDPETATRAYENERAYAAFLEGLRREYPAYFALRHGEAVTTIEELRTRLLKPGRALVAYAQSEFHLYALVVDASSANLMKLDAALLDDRVRRLNTSIAKRDDKAYRTVAYELYEQVVKPLGPHIQVEELLIIPDGPLRTVSFEVLRTAPSGNGAGTQELLLQRYTVAYLLSATTAVQFAQLARERSRGALALAPGFTDEMKQEYLARTTDSSRIDRDYLRYVRQPFAMRTAEDLGRTLNASVLLGTRATEGGFRSAMREYGILHLGTHAEMNATNPMYSRLVLSKDATGPEPDADGYLHAYEIYELDLRAQLAVLAACETGTGADDGEGVRSLGYSFAYAGCPSLVMSLWNIDEKSNSAIIARFYELIADGWSKHAALRQAKLDHLATADDELAQPYYWAGLVLVGDVAPVDISRTPSVWWFVALGALLVAVFVWVRRRHHHG